MEQKRIIQSVIGQNSVLAESIYKEHNYNINCNINNSLIIASYDEMIKCSTVRYYALDEVLNISKCTASDRVLKSHTYLFKVLNYFSHLHSAVVKTT